MVFKPIAIHYKFECNGVNVMKLGEKSSCYTRLALPMALMCS